MQSRRINDGLVMLMQKGAAGLPEYRDKLLSCGWWVLNCEKIRKSSGSYWLFVLHPQKIYELCNIHVKEMARKTVCNHPYVKLPQSYIWVFRGESRASKRLEESINGCVRPGGRLYCAGDGCEWILLTIGVLPFIGTDQPAALQSRGELD